MLATVFVKDGKFGVEVSDGQKPMVEWKDLDELEQDQTLNDYLLLHGLAPAGSWNLRNQTSRVQLKWALSPATLLGVVAPQVDTTNVEYIE